MFKEYKITPVFSQKRGRLNSDFELLPQNPIPPVIKSQPIKNFIQYTHRNTNNELIAVKPINESLIKVVRGTTIGFSVIVENSSNVVDPYSIDGLKFVWKQNDSEIYALTNLNNGKGTPYVYLEGADTTPEINGEYYCEITNEYGTTISDTFTIEVLDPDTNPLLNKNLVKNGSGNKGVSDWELSDDIKVYQFEESVNWTFNYASLYDENRWTEEARTVGELPFSFCSGDNGASFKSFWDTANRLGLTTQSNVEQNRISYDIATSGLFPTAANNTIPTLYANGAVIFNKVLKDTSEQYNILTGELDVLSTNEYDISVTIQPVFKNVSGKTLGRGTQIYYVFALVDNTGQIVNVFNDNQTYNLTSALPNGSSRQISFTKTLQNIKLDSAKTYKFCLYNGASGVEIAIDNSRFDITFDQSFDIRGVGLDPYSKWIYTNRVPNIVVNEDSSNRYAQMYPSPQSIDRYNRNDTTNKQGLVDSFNVLPTYFGREKIKFQRVGGQKDSFMTQTIDVSDISDIIDGSVVGAKSLEAQFFGYFGNGITKYNYVLYKKDDAGIESVDQILNTYIIDSKNWLLMLKAQPFAKLNIPTNISRIELIPVTDDQSDITIQCLGNNDTVLKELNVKGPDNRDVFAIKERFFISTYINKLFNIVTNLNGRSIPVTIFGQKYFDITPTSSSTNKNHQWLAKNYPKSDSKEDFDANKVFPLTGFDKGASAMFGLGENFTIPPKTRSIRLTVKFMHNSKAFSDESPSTTDWTFDDIYAEHLQDGLLYQYNNPRIGATQIKLLLGVNKIVRGSTYPTYYVQPNHIWKVNKSYLSRDIHNETTKVVYNFTDGRSTDTVLVSGSIPSTTLTQFQTVVDAGFNTELSNAIIN